MAVMARGVWTEERLDDLKAVQGEMREEFSLVRNGIRSGLKAMRAKLGEVRSEVNALARVILQLSAGLVGAMLVGFLGIVTTLIVKL